MFLKNLEKYNIILASKSPRRQFLLKDLGISYSILNTIEVNETYPPTLPKERISTYLAEKKADAYRDLINDSTLLITADTIVWFQNAVLGKPKNHDEAIFMLKSLSGNMHEVITGVCIKTLHKSITFKASTKVYFANLTNEEIVYYVNTYHPFDKAGSYGVQEFIGYIGIERIEGSYFNVMGLPIHQLYKELKKL